MTARQKAAGISVLALYAAFRLILIPADPASTRAFTHDSGYLATVARNLLAGRGYVNDANWLLFLNPPSLPMPYHNANPLYPTLSAAIAGPLSMDPAKAAAIISALSNLLLAFAVFWLVLRLSQRFWFAMAAAATAALWPGNFRDSFGVLPDALCTACVASALAVAVYARSGWTWALSGALIGAAWLTRSSALLMLPGLSLWLYLQDRTRFLPRLACLLAGAALLASPWLVRNYRVRGNALASDNSYYWLQEYHAFKLHCGVEQYWRTLTPPPTLGKILRTEPLEFAAFIVKRIPTFCYFLLAGLADWSKPGAAAFLAAVALALWDLSRRVYRSPEFLAVALTVSLSVASLLVRPETVEVRYLSVPATLLAAGMLVSFSSWSAGRLKTWGRAALVACLLLFAVPPDAGVLRLTTRPDAATVAYRNSVLAVSSRIGTNEPIITDRPYLYTYYTRGSAISPPYPSKAELLSIMARYSARYVLLPRKRLEYFYPAAPAALAPDFVVEAEFGENVLLKLL